MLVSQLDDARLDLGAHLMGARLRLGGAVHEPGQAVVGVLHKPLVDRLTAHSSAARDVCYQAPSLSTSRTA